MLIYQRKRLWSLENLIKEKDKRIENMKIELKNLMNLIRTLEKTIKEFDKTEEHADTVKTEEILYEFYMEFFNY